MRYSTFLKLVIPGIAVCGCTQRDTETGYDVAPVPETRPARDGVGPTELPRETAKEQSDLRRTEPPATPGPEAMSDPGTWGGAKSDVAAQNARIERVDTRIAALTPRVQQATNDLPTLRERLQAIRELRAIIEHDRTAISTTPSTQWDALHASVENNLKTLETNVESLEATLGPVP
jgi:hypothetical protein